MNPTHIITAVSILGALLFAEAIREWWLVGRSIDRERGNYKRPTHCRSQFRGQESTH